jgi:hypothetical protein
MRCNTVKFQCIVACEIVGFVAVLHCILVQIHSSMRMIKYELKINTQQKLKMTLTEGIYKFKAENPCW